MPQADVSFSGMVVAGVGVEGINAGAQFRSDSLTHRQLQRSAACCARRKRPRNGLAVGLSRPAIMPG